MGEPTDGFGGGTSGIAWRAAGEQGTAAGVGDGRKTPVAAKLGCTSGIACVGSELVVGDGGHSPNHGGVLFPDALRWLWRSV